MVTYREVGYGADLTAADKGYFLILVPCNPPPPTPSRQLSLPFKCIVHSPAMQINCTTTCIFIEATFEIKLKEESHELLLSRIC